MNVRTRKFVGTIVTVVYMMVYSLVAMAIGGQYFVGRGALIELVYFVAAGLAWLPIAMFLIRWMNKPDLTDIDPAESVEQSKRNT